jgi:hypothetical protein
MKKLLLIAIIAIAAHAKPMMGFGMGITRSQSLSFLDAEFVLGSEELLLTGSLGYGITDECQDDGYYEHGVNVKRYGRKGDLGGRECSSSNYYSIGMIGRLGQSNHYLGAGLGITSIRTGYENQDRILGYYSTDRESEIKVSPVLRYTFIDDIILSAKLGTKAQNGSMVTVIGASVGFAF